MKTKFPSYVTRKFYLCLITLEFPSYATRDLNFIKNPELRNYVNFLKKEISSYYFNK